MMPGQFLSLPREERAFIIAAIQIKLEKDRKEMSRNKAKRK
ncbi:hypothetical protein [Ruminiclostridium cellobioparum]|jgi:hypothetical protein|nr:hypothetical protein [Ruminiclostridium cellobioparum]